MGSRWGEKPAVLPHADHQVALNAVLDISVQILQLKPTAVGHRIVHGGEHFASSALIDESMLQQVASISHLAPLHNPANLLGIHAAQAAFPSIPQVGVFDTAFHMSMPPRAIAMLYPKPGIKSTASGATAFTEQAIAMWHNRRQKSCKSL